MDSRSENSTTNLNGSVDNGVDRNQEEQSAGADNDSGLEMRSGSETKWLCRPLEIVGLCIAVTLVWALFVLPFILFYFPKNRHDAILNAGVTQNHTTLLQNGTLECREEFFLEDGVCVPDCFSNQSWILSDISEGVLIVTLIALIIGFIATIAFLIIAFIRCKEVFIFPFVFAVYIMFDLLVLAIVLLIGALIPSLNCPARNFLITRVRSTPFCVLSGMVFIYILFQIGCWWFFHMAAFFWKIRYPFHALMASKSNKIRYLHTGLIVTGFVVPLLPVIIIVADYAAKLKTDEFLRSENVTFASGGLGFCGWVNGEATLFGFILPLCLLTATGTTLLIFIIWLLHKQYVFFKTQQSKNSVKIGRAELILVIAFCYYVLLGVVNLTTYAVRLGNLNALEQALVNYFDCEGGGHDKDNPCDRSLHRRISAGDGSFMGSILLFLYPTVHLAYVLNIKGLRQRCRMCFSSQKKTVSRSNFGHSHGTIRSQLSSTKL